MAIEVRDDCILHCLIIAKEQSNFSEKLIIKIDWRKEIKYIFSRISVDVLSWKIIQISPYRKIRK